MASISIAFSLPSASAPTLTPHPERVAGAARRKTPLCGSVLDTTGRPVRSVTRAGDVLDEDLLLDAEPAADPGLDHPDPVDGMSSSRATIRRTWNGTWVEYRTRRRASSR